MITSRNNAGKTRDRPFEPGNPGRLRGARNLPTWAVEALLQDEGEALTPKVVEMALEGDITALRLCPPRRDWHVSLEPPVVKDASGVAEAQAAIMAALATRELTPSEAAAISGVVEIRRKALETVELEERVVALERRSNR